MQPCLVSSSTTSTGRKPSSFRLTMAKPQAGPSRQRPTVLDSLQHLPGIEDPERLAFLYANILPLKERNPASYKTVVAWWHQLLLDITTRNSEDSLVLHASDQLLASLTSSESGRPLSLGGVLVCPFPPIEQSTHGRYATPTGSKSLISLIIFRASWPVVPKKCLSAWMSS